MLGPLSEKEIEHLLMKQVTGRLGCHANGLTYIVPINYIYRHPYILAHSAEGQKIKMMRENPNVCFQVDEIKSVFRWKSVIAWGRFEEITDNEEKQKAMQGLIHRIMPLAENPTEHPSHGIAEKDTDIGLKVNLVVYRIELSKITGRFENS
jgi:nitroimidazol reductase NimA-like FMN-containing flavoprotein (pyridoxamine 5'-phosphate oxidase superfamily)